MEGPRTLRKHERAALEILVDNVFCPGRPGAMYGFFPSFFSEKNLENHFVHVEGERVISHAGMAQRWASLGGCTVRVGEAGAVATDPDFRGRNLGWEVMEAIYAKARRDGVDFMLISGDRSIYLRAGARKVGCVHTATLDTAHAGALSRPEVTVQPFQREFLPACQMAYARQHAHFIRPLDDWDDFILTGTACCQPSSLWVACKNRHVAGYLVLGRVREDGTGDLLEYAGDESVLSAALMPLMEQQGITALSLKIQPEHLFLHAALDAAGVERMPRAADGTVLILQFEPFMRRLHPYFEMRIGMEAAKELQFKEEDGMFYFSDGQNTVVTDRGEAAEMIFGKAEPCSAPGLLGHIFPVPSLAYGLNYI